MKRVARMVRLVIPFVLIVAMAWSLYSYENDVAPSSTFTYTGWTPSASTCSGRTLLDAPQFKLCQQWKTGASTSDAKTAITIPAHHVYNLPRLELELGFEALFAALLWFGLWQIERAA